jgi:methionyl-tRNA formyltransferase
VKKVAFVIYRSWAYEIYKDILAFQKTSKLFDVPILITTKEAEFVVPPGAYIVEGKDNNHIHAILKDLGVDIVFFYGWSWIVEGNLLSHFLCLCLHPSPLPRYRGGSPLQHQIISGEERSAVSVFKMDRGIDDGDIYKQTPFSLKGSLDDIFKRIVKVGTKVTKNLIIDVIRNKVTFLPQKNLNEYPPLKRRKKEESVVPFKDLNTFSYLRFYNLVRALTNPYPNVVIIVSEYKIFLQKIVKVKKPPEKYTLLCEKIDFSDKHAPLLYVELKDSYVLLEKFSIFKNDTLITSK